MTQLKNLDESFCDDTAGFGYIRSDMEGFHGILFQELTIMKAGGFTVHHQSRSMLSLS